MQGAFGTTACSSAVGQEAAVDTRPPLQPEFVVVEHNPVSYPSCGVGDDAVAEAVAGAQFTATRRGGPRAAVQTGMKQE